MAVAVLVNPVRHRQEQLEQLIIVGHPRRPGLSGTLSSFSLVRSPYSERYASRAMIPPRKSPCRLKCVIELRTVSTQRAQRIRRERRKHQEIRIPLRPLRILCALCVENPLAFLGVLDDYLVVAGGGAAPPAQAERFAAPSPRALVAQVGAGGGRAAVRHRQDVHGAGGVGNQAGRRAEVDFAQAPPVGNPAELP